MNRAKYNTATPNVTVDCSPLPTMRAIDAIKLNSRANEYTEKKREKLV